MGNERLSKVKESWGEMLIEERTRAAKLVEAIERWLSWYGEDHGKSVFPDHKEGERDQGALDIVFARQALTAYRSEKKDFK